MYLPLVHQFVWRRRQPARTRILGILSQKSKWFTREQLLKEDPNLWRLTLSWHLKKLVDQKFVFEIEMESPRPDGTRPKVPHYRISELGASHRRDLRGIYW